LDVPKTWAQRSLPDAIRLEDATIFKMFQTKEIMDNLQSHISSSYPDVTSLQNTTMVVYHVNRRTAGKTNDPSNDSSNVPDIHVDAPDCQTLLIESDEQLEITEEQLNKAKCFNFWVPYEGTLDSRDFLDYNLLFASNFRNQIEDKVSKIMDEESVNYTLKDLQNRLSILEKFMTDNKDVLQNEIQNKEECQKLIEELKSKMAKEWMTSNWKKIEEVLNDSSYHNASNFIYNGYKGEIGGESISEGAFEHLLHGVLEQMKEAFVKAGLTKLQKPDNIDLTQVSFYAPHFRPSSVENGVASGFKEVLIFDPINWGHFGPRSSTNDVKLFRNSIQIGVALIPTPKD
jgi:hypothetical protein